MRILPRGLSAVVMKLSCYRHYCKILITLGSSSHASHFCVQYIILLLQAPVPACISYSMPCICGLFGNVGCVVTTKL